MPKPALYLYTLEVQTDEGTRRNPYRVVANTALEALNKVPNPDIVTDVSRGVSIDAT